MLPEHPLSSLIPQPLHGTAEDGSGRCTASIGVDAAATREDDPAMALPSASIGLAPERVAAGDHLGRGHLIDLLGRGHWIDSRSSSHSKVIHNGKSGGFGQELGLAGSAAGNAKRTTDSGGAVAGQPQGKSGLGVCGREGEPSGLGADGGATAGWTLSALISHLHSSLLPVLPPAIPGNEPTGPAHLVRYYYRGRREGMATLGITDGVGQQRGEDLSNGGFLEPVELRFAEWKAWFDDTVRRGIDVLSGRAHGCGVKSTDGVWKCNFCEFKNSGCTQWKDKQEVAKQHVMPSE